MRGQSYVILAIIFVIIIAIFAVINVEPVEVNYLFNTGQAPLILVILFSVLMGGIITAAVGLVKIIHLQRERKMLQHENNQMREILKKHKLLDTMDKQDKNKTEK
ncbi:LapA family protein [Virgibacillus siamensis]|uniref:LapA family protein n=1 Tax=Virgibacillus siamensis TaxID=480071 RepID=UPI0009868F74|nr:lipopolysaccharide assembly protein LapA domain-containing protein [Virgibacillus siamensis]